MPKYVIEKFVPGAGQWTAEQLRLASQATCDVLKQLGPEIEWLQSYVTDRKLYSIYNAPTEQVICEYARRTGFSANAIQEVRTMFGPFTAERSGD